LFDALALAEDHFGNARPTKAVVVDASVVVNHDLARA